MNLPSYEHALTAASDEMQKLLKQRSEIDARIAQLKKTMEALSALMTPPPSEASSTPLGDAVGYLGEPSGISDSIRQVLNESKVPLTAGEIKAELIGRGVELSGYANAGAVIHNTLQRLARQAEIMSVQNPGESAAYSLTRHPIHHLTDRSRKK